MQQLAATTSLLVLFAGCSGSPTAAVPAASPTATPPTRADAVVDDYHGTAIADPYRWLEDQDGAEVLAWARSQNDFTRGLLDAVPERPAIHARLQELWSFARYEAPTRAGTRWFWRKNDGLQNQPVLYTGSDPQGEGEVLLDPNMLSTDGTVAIAAFVPDQRGERIAYATAARGSDWRTWRVLDVATRTTLADELPWSKFAPAAWTHDGKGFFYQRYPAPAAGETFQASNTDPQLCYHEVGTDPAGDRVVYERPDQPEWGFQPTVTEDGRHLVVTATHGTDRRTRVFVADLGQEGWPVRPLRIGFDAAWQFCGSDATSFYFRTDLQAPRGRVVAIDSGDPDQQREVVPESAQALQAVRYVGGHLVCSYLRDASSALQVFTADGQPAGEIALPQLGTVSDLSGRGDDDAVWFQFASFTSPPQVYRYDFATQQLTAARVPDFRGNAADLVTERVFLQSRDGTRLCLFLVHRKDLRLDGKAQCYLYGYGGFGISLTPRFRVPDFVFAERGGVFAQAVLRGGGEYGEEWHKAGMLGAKQNVFDDFIACAEYLVRNGYTRKEQLAIGGGSNGGLLVGAVLTQRPDLIGAAVPEVGVLDMLRYHQFTIGRAWASEYGRSDAAEQFAWLYRYSPLHNVKPGTKYPPVLVMTGDHDDRVLPGHSYKFAAALQAAQAGEAPILLRVEFDAGHGAGKPVSKQIDEAADRLAFLQGALR